MPGGRSQAADRSSAGTTAGAGAKQAAARLTGRILDVGGKPLPSASIHLHHHDRVAHHWDDAWRVAKSSVEGRYAFEELPAGQFAVSADSPGLATGWIDATLEEGQKLDADIKLAKAVPVPVTVRDREGRPIAGARVGSLGVTGPNPTF